MMNTLNKAKEGFYYGNHFQDLGEILNIPIQGGLGYANGLEIGQSLGYNNESQRDLGRMSALNNILNSLSTALNNGTKRREVRRREQEDYLDSFYYVPNDPYTYESFSNSQYYKKGGMKKQKEYQYGGIFGNSKQSILIDGVAKDGVKGEFPSLQPLSREFNPTENLRKNYQMGGLPPLENKIPTSLKGLLEYPDGPVRVPSNNITMKDINYPVMAYPDNDPPVLMQPNKDYKFKNSKEVIEIPLRDFQRGGRMDRARTKQENLLQALVKNQIPLKKEEMDIDTFARLPEERHKELFLELMKKTGAVTKEEGASLEKKYDNSRVIKKTNYVNSTYVYDLDGTLDTSLPAFQEGGSVDLDEPDFWNPDKEQVYLDATDTVSTRDNTLIPDSTILEDIDIDLAGFIPYNSLYNVSNAATKVDNLEALNSGNVKEFSEGTSTPYNIELQGKTIAARHNNVFNIKYGEFAKSFGAKKGSPGRDGGSFAIFPDVQTGIKAQRALLQRNSYKDLTVDAAMKRWSNWGFRGGRMHGYGGEIYPEVASKKVNELTDEELQELSRRQSRREDRGVYTQLIEKGIL